MKKKLWPRKCQSKYNYNKKLQTVESLAYALAVTLKINKKIINMFTAMGLINLVHFNHLNTFTNQINLNTENLKNNCRKINCLIIIVG